MWPLYKNGLGWNIGNGGTVRFWEDSWIKETEPLINHCTDKSLVVEGRLAKDMLDMWGGWNIGALQHTLDDQTIQRFRSKMPPSELAGPDRMVWMCSKHGKFSIAETYQVITNSDSFADSKTWDQAWKFNGPQRIRLFIWLVLKGKIMTNAERWRRGFAQSNCCPLCDNESESLIHLFRDFHWAKSIWDKLVPYSLHVNFFSMNFVDWFSSNITNNMNINLGNHSWITLFGILCWNIWKARNAFTFGNEFTGTYQIIESSTRMAKDMSNQSTGCGQELRAIGRRAKWTRPDAPWIKINTDGATATRDRLAGDGGIARDCNGRWLFGYSRNIGVCDALQVELWGILDGLNIAWSWRFEFVIIESDSLNVIEWINNGNKPGCYNTLVEEILRLLDYHWTVHIQHTPRDANQVADYLAKRSTKDQTGITILTDVPADVRHLLDQDADHPTTRRLIAPNV